jgi:hypothetical protein
MNILIVVALIFIVAGILAALKSKHLSKVDGLTFESRDT